MEMDSSKTPQPGMEFKISATIAHSQEYAGLDKSGEKVLHLSESVADISQSDADVSQSVADVFQSDTNISQSDADVSYSLTDISQSDNDVSQSVADISEVIEDNPLDLHNFKVNAQRSSPPFNVRDSGPLSEASQEGAQGSSSSRNRNIVRLCWTGDAAHPLDRERVLSLLINSMGFESEDIFAITNVPGSKFDVNFQVAESLLKFWSLYKTARATDMWISVQARPVSSSQVKTVTIAFKHEMIRRKDVLSWLQQHCTVLSPVRRVRDCEQFWTGEWRAQVKLHMVNNVLQHLPITFFIWNERGVVSYFGQPRICYVCESTEHFARDCPIEKQRREADLDLYRMEEEDDYDYYTQYNGCGVETASCRQSVGIRL